MSGKSAYLLVMMVKGERESVCVILEQPAFRDANVDATWTDVLIDPFTSLVVYILLPYNGQHLLRMLESKPPSPIKQVVGKQPKERSIPSPKSHSNTPTTFHTFVMTGDEQVDTITTPQPSKALASLLLTEGQFGCEMQRGGQRT